MQNYQIILGTFCVISHLYILGSLRHHIGGEREPQALVEKVTAQMVSCLSLFHACFSFFVTIPFQPVVDK